MILAYITQSAFTCSKLTIETLEQRCEICSKLTIKTPKRRQRRCFGVFIVNFKHISHFCSSAFIVNFEYVIAGWVRIFGYLPSFRQKLKKLQIHSKNNLFENLYRNIILHWVALSVLIFLFP